MKSYKEMSDAVFRRRDEYNKALEKKKKAALKISLSVCAICLAVTGAFAVFKNTSLIPDPLVTGTKPNGTSLTEEATKCSLSGNATNQGSSELNSEALYATESSGEASDTVFDPPESTTAAAQIPNSTPANEATSAILPTVSPLPSKPVSALPTEINTDPAPTTAVSLQPSTEYVHPTNAPTEPTLSDSSEGESPDRVPASPEATQAPTEAAPDVAEPDVAEPNDVPPCGADSYPVTIYGRVTDENGKGLKGAEFGLYKDGKLTATATSDSSGCFSIACGTVDGNTYVAQLSACEGYSVSNAIFVIAANSDVPYVFVNYPL